MRKLRACAPDLVLFVRQFYGNTSHHFWWDSDGQRHTVTQGEGCDQGDALAPALFALGMHSALVEASASFQPGEFLAAFLDDVYLVTTPERAMEDIKGEAEGASAN